MIFVRWIKIQILMYDMNSKYGCFDYFFPWFVFSCLPKNQICHGCVSHANHNQGRSASSVCICAWMSLNVLHSHVRMLRMRMDTSWPRMNTWMVRNHVIKFVDARHAVVHIMKSFGLNSGIVQNQNTNLNLETTNQRPEHTIRDVITLIHNAVELLGWLQISWHRMSIFLQWTLKFGIINHKRNELKTDWGSKRYLIHALKLACPHGRC